MTDDLKTIAGSLVAALISAALFLPKLLNMRKGDQIDGDILKRIERHEKRMDRMDKTIHKQQIKLTRFAVLVVQLVGIIVGAGNTVPPAIQAEIDDLMAEEPEELHEEDEK